MNRPASLPPELLSRAADRDALAGLTRLAKQTKPTILAHLRVLSMRKWWLAAIALLTAILAYVAVGYMAPTYRSTSTVLLESGKQRVVSIEEVYQNTSPTREHFQTQAEIMRSREVALRIVRKLKLAEHPEFAVAAPGSGGILESLRGLLGQAPAELTAAQREEVALQRFAKQLSVEPVRQSQLVRISFESGDRDLAAQIANQVAESYIRADMDAKFQATQTANKWLTERLAELRVNLESSERELQRVRERGGLVETRADQQGGTGKQLEEASQKLVEARARRAAAEQSLLAVRSGQVEQLPSVFANPAVAKARETEAEAQRRVTEAVQRFGAEHPRYQQAQKELADAREFTRRQIDTAAGSIQREVDAARAAERALEESSSRSRGTIMQQNRKEVDLVPLEREVAANRQLYTTFLSRVKETGAAGDFQSASARLVDPAAPALRPFKPARLETVLLASLGGLLFTGAAFIVLDRLRDTVRRTDDVEEKLGVSLLAAVPRVKPADIDPPGEIQFKQPNSLFVESVRSAGTALMLATLDVKHKIVAVTSTVPAEGKSTVALNIALTHARRAKVLLIDCDLRRATLSSRLGFTSQMPGIADVVAGTIAATAVGTTLNGTNLTVIPAGTLPPNPLDLLSSERFASVLRGVSEGYELVIIDTPPAHLTSDVLVIGGHCTGLVYVVKADETPVPLISATMRRAQMFGIRVLGVVLNQHDFRRAEKYFGDSSAYEKYGYEATYGQNAR